MDLRSSTPQLSPPPRIDLMSIPYKNLGPIYNPEITYTLENGMTTNKKPIYDVNKINSEDMKFLLKARNMSGSELEKHRKKIKRIAKRASSNDKLSPLEKFKKKIIP